MSSSFFTTCILVLCLGYLSGSASADVRPYRVIDGDTFEVDGEKFRIRGMDTPEMKAKNPRERELAQIAKTELDRLLVTGYEVKRTGKDKYGRTVAEVFIGGRDISEIMVERGLARAYPYKLKKDKVKALSLLEAEAKNKRIGIWERN